WWLVAIAVTVPPTGARPPVAAPNAPPATDTALPGGAVARLGQTRLRHADRPTCVAFAPDGKTFVTGSQDGTVRAWSVASGELVRMTQKPRQGITALRYTHLGARLAVHYPTENVIRFLDPETLQETGAVPLTNRHRFAFSPDGTWLAASDTAGNLVVTEVAPDLPKLELSQADVFDFRPDGKALAIGSTKGTVAVHLVTGGKPTFKLTNAGAVRGLAFSPDGKRLAVGAQSPEGTDTVRVYATGSDKPVAEIAGMSLPHSWLGSDTLAVGNGSDVGVYNLTNKEFTGRVNGSTGAFAVAPDGGKVVATGTAGLRVRLWDLRTGKQLHAENETFPEPALLVGTAGAQSLFLLAGESAYLWPIGAPGAKPVGALPGRAVSAAAARDALVVGTPDAVCLYTHFDPLKPLPVKPHRTFPKSARTKIVTITPDGNRIAWAEESGTVFVTDSAGKHRTQLPAVTASVLALQFSPDGTKLAQFGRDGFLRLWSVGGEGAAPGELWKVRLGRGQRATIAFSPNGQLIAAASLAQVPVFHVADGTEVFKVDRYSDQGLAQHAVFSPDSRLLVFGSST
ncbi:MAG TPA: WD40 repeat domain-containing protein, partial [Gemmata sp.]